MSQAYPSNLYYRYTNTYPNGQSQNRISGIYKMKLYGTGEVKATPDIAIVTIGIETENKDISTAQKENSIKTKKVIETLKAYNIKEEDIKNTSYIIIPEYDYIEGRRIFRGYNVANTLSITIRNIEETGDIIDASIEAGASKVNNIEFTVSELDKYYSIALNSAINDSIAKAESVAKNLKVTLNRTPIKIDEERFEYAPQHRAQLLSSSTSTPIMKGTLDLKATVVAFFAYSIHQGH